MAQTGGGQGRRGDCAVEEGVRGAAHAVAETVAEVFRRMAERGVACCPVVSETGELCGMVSRVDLLRALRPSREVQARTVEEVGRLPILEVMRRGVVTVEPEDSLVAAVDLFVDTRLYALPVVRRGAGRLIVVGLVTQTDALRRLMRVPQADRA